MRPVRLLSRRMGRPVDRSVDSTSASQAGQGVVHRSFHLLQLIVASPEPVGVRELARRADLARSSVSRLVGVLEELGMVERTADGKAMPGLALQSLTGGGDAPGHVGQRLRPLMAELVDRFGESAAVGFDSGEQFLYVAGERRGGAIQVTEPTGEGSPYHLVASGLVAMAYWSDRRLGDYLASELEAATPYSVIAPTQIRKRLMGARSDGFVWALQELDLEVNGLAVPVFDQKESCVAVVSLYGPDYRLSPTHCPELGAELAEVVRDRAAHLLGLD